MMYMYILPLSLFILDAPMVWLSGIAMCLLVLLLTLLGQGLALSPDCDSDSLFNKFYKKVSRKR